MRRGWYEAGVSRQGRRREELGGDDIRSHVPSTGGLECRLGCRGLQYEPTLIKYSVTLH